MRLRPLAAAAVLLLSGGVLAACGSDDPAAPSAGAGSGAGAGVFPVTVEHRFGTTTVPSEP